MTTSKLFQLARVVMQIRNRFVASGVSVALLGGCSTSDDSPVAPKQLAFRTQKLDVASRSSSRPLPNVPGTCITGVRLADGRYMTRETTIRFPKKILGTAGKIARFAYQGPIDADSMWSRVAICAIPDSPVAVSFFASAFNGRVLRSPTLPSSVSRLRAEVLASAETVTDEIPELAKDLPVYFATDASLRLTEFSVGSLTACDPNAIIPEPDCIPAGGGGSGGGGNTQGPEYCDPNAVQIPPDCIIENEYIPDPDPASPQVFLTTGSSVAGCFDFSRRDLYINGSFFGVVLTSGFSCTTPMLFVGMTTALERESCFIWGFFCKWQRYGPPFLQNFPYLTVGQAVHQTTPYRKGYYRNGTSFDYSFASGYRKVSFTASPKVFVAR